MTLAAAGTDGQSWTTNFAYGKHDLRYSTSRQNSCSLQEDMTFTVIFVLSVVKHQSHQHFFFHGYLIQ